MQKIFLLVFILFFTACSSKPYTIKSEKKYTNKGINKIYIVSHGWHTGFVLPSKEVFKQIPSLKKRFAKAQYLEFGWGDKGFYQANEITTAITLRAIFTPSESVVHVVSLPTKDVNKYFSSSKIEFLSPNDEELKLLIKFIKGSFFFDKDKLVQLKKGIYGNSQFYKGLGDYYLFNTCNKWTAKGLKSMGMDIFTPSKLTASSIMNYLNKYEK